MMAIGDLIYSNRNMLFLDAVLLIASCDPVPQGWKTKLITGVTRVLFFLPFVLKKYLVTLLFHYYDHW